MASKAVDRSITCSQDCNGSNHINIFIAELLQIICSLMSAVLADVDVGKSGKTKMLNTMFPCE